MEQFCSIIKIIQSFYCSHVHLGIVFIGSRLDSMVETFFFFLIFFRRGSLALALSDQVNKTY